MKLPFINLQAAAQAYLGESAGGRLGKCFVAAGHTAIEPGVLLTPEQASVLLSAAVMAAEPRQAVDLVGRSMLVALEFSGEAGDFDIPVDDVAEHPLLAPWITASLSGAIAKALMAGAIFTHLSSGAPIFEAVEFGETPDGLSARLRLKFPVGGSHVGVVAHYGEQPPARTALSTVRIVTGDAIVSIGTAAAAATRAADKQAASAQLQAPLDLPDLTPRPNLLIH